MKSSNGTFVNGQRLSNECEESMPVEIKNYDEIEFGIEHIKTLQLCKDCLEKLQSLQQEEL